VEVCVAIEHPQIAATLVDPQEQIGLCLERIHSGEPGTIDRGNTRQIDVVVPVGGDLLLSREGPPQPARQVVAVRLDDLEHLGIAPRASELDHRVGAAARQAALLHQQPLLLGVHEPGYVHVGRQRIVRVQPRHLGVDELRAPLVGQRHAMVAVGHEEQSPDLVDLDRGHVAIREGCAQRRDP
jgi:hypothetical protein